MKPLPGLDDVAAGAEHCSYNAKLCRTACPVAAVTGRESATPWGINREISAAARTGVIDRGTAAAVYACTGCRACGGLCLPGLDLPTHVRAGRAAVVEAGVAPAGVEAARGRPAPPEPALGAGAAPGAAVVVYPGCRSSDGAALGWLLGAAGVAYDVVGGESCCGARSVDAGYPAEGLAFADDLARRLADAEQIVVADPHCARWLAWECGDDRVRTAAVFLAELADRLRFKPSAVTVAWHDPCWLGRGLGQYAEPRTLLAAAGATVTEPEHTGALASCSGGGMAYAETDPAGAAGIAQRRAAELSATGADAVVTGCPDAAGALRQAGVEAADLTGWLVGRLEGGQP